MPEQEFEEFVDWLGELQSSVSATVERIGPLPRLRTGGDVNELVEAIRAVLFDLQPFLLQAAYQVDHMPWIMERYLNTSDHEEQVARARQRLTEQLKAQAAQMTKMMSQLDSHELETADDRLTTMSTYAVAEGDLPDVDDAFAVIWVRHTPGDQEHIGYWEGEAAAIASAHQLAAHIPIGDELRVFPMIDTERASDPIARIPGLNEGNLDHPT